MNDTLTDTEIELTQLRGSLEEWRIYLAGPCTEDCVKHHQVKRGQPYNGHKHYTERYEDNRGSVVMLNRLLSGEYDYASMLRQIGERI